MKHSSSGLLKYFRSSLLIFININGFSISLYRFKDKISFADTVRADTFEKLNKKSINTERYSLHNIFSLLDNLSAFKNKDKDLLKMLSNFYS